MRVVKKLLSFIILSPLILGASICAAVCFITLCLLGRPLDVLFNWAIKQFD